MFYKRCERLIGTYLNKIQFLSSLPASPNGMGLDTFEK